MNHIDHPLLKNPIPPRSGAHGTRYPKALAEFIPAAPDILSGLYNRHIISARQFDRETVVQLSRMAAVYEASPVLFHKPLAGKLLISAFYEPSTRTRLSFESAWHRLGGDIMSITDAKTTGIAKGESLEDVGEMFNNYGDAVVLRDTSEQSVYRMLDSLFIPIINAGNGIDEHPTQALSDLYTLFKWRPELTLDTVPEGSRIKFGVIGSPGKMRTVRSLLLLLSLFSRAIKEIIIINPDSDLFDPGQKEELESAGLKISTTGNLRNTLPELDVVYINSIAWIGDTFEKLAGDMKLHRASPLKENSIVLHPLARGEELDADLDGTPHNWYFAQARSAVFLRMALLTCTVQRAGLVQDMADPVRTGVEN